MYRVTPLKISPDDWGSTQTPNSISDIELLSELLIRLCLAHCYQDLAEAAASGRGRSEPLLSVRQHFSCTTPFTGSERFTTKELKPIAFPKATGSIMRLCCFTRPGELIHEHQSVHCQRSEPLCFNLRFELHTSWA